MFPPCCVCGPAAGHLLASCGLPPSCGAMRARRSPSNPGSAGLDQPGPCRLNRQRSKSAPNDHPRFNRHHGGHAVPPAPPTGKTRRSDPRLAAPPADGEDQHHDPTARRHHTPDRAAARHRGRLADRPSRPWPAGSVRSATTGSTTTLTTERITIEPFDLRTPVRHDVVIDRLAWWYYHPAGVAEEGRAGQRHLPAEQPVHLPGHGEALRVLRDDPARLRHPAHRAGAVQEPGRLTRSGPTPRRPTTCRSTWTRSRRGSASRCS